MDAEKALKYEYEEITDIGIVLRERRAGYSTHGYDYTPSCFSPFRIFVFQEKQT